MDTELQLGFYTQMYRIRKVEEALLDLFSKGLLTGTTHTSIGQEPCAVGVISALDRDRDIVVSNHRAHGHYIAYCGDVGGLVAELMGRSGGVCGGVGGSQHLCRKNFYTNGIQGGIAPVAAGMAFAEKVKKTGAIVSVFLGDGTFGEGAVYEAMNISSLWKLPVLFVLEHNGYAQSTPSHMQHAGELTRRAEPFGIRSAEARAWDVMEVYRAAKEASGLVRDEGGPFFLVLHTYRLAPHSKGDDTRPKEEVEAYKKKDPLAALRRRLALEDAGAVDDIEARVRVEVAEAVEQSARSLPASWEHYGRKFNLDKAAWTPPTFRA